MGWPRHETIDDTLAFLAFSDSQWQTQPAGPLLLELNGTIIGTTGLAFESPDVASKAYVLATPSWGRGFATEALAAIVSLAQELQICRLYALCHADHYASSNVLEKNNFQLERVLEKSMVFPNLGDPDAQDVSCYVAVEKSHHG